ncbi:MAG: VWA domain-containing protein, partial [Gemmatimonadota bacterium]
VYLTLRSVLIHKPEDFAAFDQLFETYFDAAGNTAQKAVGDPRLPRPGMPKPGQPLGFPSLQDWLRNGRAPDASSQVVAVPLLSDRDAQGAADFSTFRSDQLDQLRRVAARLARRLHSLDGRRWQSARTGRSLSFRGTMRAALRTDGELVGLRFRKHRRLRAKLVVLCDVSSSMDLYTRLLLQFLYALQHSFARVETFVFSTRIERVTRGLDTDSYQAALARLRELPSGWAGGTRIGASLEQFNSRWPGLVDGKTIVLILSDGWDTGEPSVLAAALRYIHGRAAKLIWLNPLAGSAGYSPETAGLRAALPFVDVLWPAHDLRSLESLGRHFSL